MGNHQPVGGTAKAGGQLRAAHAADFLRARRADLSGKARQCCMGRARLSWGEVYGRARALASGLERMGVRLWRGGVDPVAQYAGDDRGAFRRARLRSGAEHHQFPPGCARPSPISSTMPKAGSCSSIPPSPRSPGPPSARSRKAAHHRDRRSAAPAPTGLGEIEYETLLAAKRCDAAPSLCRGRMGRDLPQLYQRHDRQPERRRLSPSRRLSERARLGARPSR